MTNHTYKTLEFNKIIDQLCTLAATESGKKLIKSLQPDIETKIIKEKLQETRVAEGIYQYTGKTGIRKFLDIREYVCLAEKGSLLSPEIINQIDKFFVCVNDIINLFSTYTNETLSLGKIVDGLNDYKEVHLSIAKTIDRTGYILDSASPELRNIRRKINQQQEHLKTKVNSLISTYSSYLQENIVTQRNNRYVIPVKQEHRGAVKGIIHDQSASGATLFIEPQSVVELNNQVKALFLDEERECERIIRKLGALIANEKEFILADYESVVKLDVVFAKAILAKKMRATEPKVVEEPCIKIINGRHPLIDPKEVVPITVDVGEDFKGLVITGPNTGGKTVTLKTIGLFAMMAQSGLFLPATDGCVVGPFTQIFADIGDEQSIEQNLSTFSSHIKNISSIIKQAGYGSLVLLDELGAGTDPSEGAALAISILDEIYNSKACIAATTHYNEVKVYSTEHEGIQNASMEFNVETLRPTYKLIMGVTGKSNAFEIAKRIGLSANVIKHAKETVNRDKLTYDELNRELELLNKQIAIEKKKAQTDRDEALKLRTEAQFLINKQQKENQDLLQKAKEEALTIVNKAKEEADELIREIYKAKNESNEKESNRKLEQARKELKARSDDLYNATQKAKKVLSGGLKADDLKMGREVYVKSLGQNAIIASKPKGKDVMVQAGIMKVTVKLADLQSIQNEEKNNKTTVKTPIASSGIKLKKKTAKLELDIRGMVAEDAMLEVDQYIDNAFLSHLKEVVIVHGKGTGRLRTVVHQCLRKNKHVESFRLGEYGEGDTGVTVVSIK